MKQMITLVAIILAVLVADIPATAQHYDDWTEYKFLQMATGKDRWFEVQKDYTISLPSYFKDSTKLPFSVKQNRAFFHNWVKYKLPIVDWDFIKIEKGGILTVKKGYRWDGATLPFWRPHRDYNIRSSMVHDVLYDLMRMGIMEADHNHKVWCGDKHSYENTGDVNRMIADMMIYMIAVEDGQKRNGIAQSAESDWDVLRPYAPCRTHNTKYLYGYKYHVSELTAYAGDGKVELKWQRADNAGECPDFGGKFIPYNWLIIERSDGHQITVSPFGLTSYTDENVVNGVAYGYQLVPDPTNKNQRDWSNEDIVVPMLGAGNALRFDGINDYIEANTVSNDLANGNNLSQYQAQTMEAWVYPEDHGSHPMMITAFNTITGGNYNLMAYDANAHKFCYYDDRDGFVYASDESPPNRWYHVAVALDRVGFGALYVNGEVQVWLDARVEAIHGARFSIGQEWDGDSPSQHFKGMLDEVRVWSVERSQDEIQADMYQPLKGNEPNLMGLWHFDEPHDGVYRFADDATAHANRGTLIGYANSERPFVPSGAMRIPTDVDDDPRLLVPLEFALAQNYPNPFNPQTKIEYSLPARSAVTIDIFNSLGQKVTTLLSDEKPAGNYEIIWNGKDSEGEQASTGIYFYRLRAGDFVQTKKMLLLK